MKYEVKLLKNTTDIITHLQNTPADTDSLDLIWNNLGNIPTPELLATFKAISQTLTSFSLHGNYLGNKGSDLAPVFQTMPRSVISLDLSWNKLGYMNIADLTKAFAALPPVTSLNVSWNKLGSKFSTELGQFFSAIPQTVLILDLSNNEFDNESFSILQRIPLSTHTLNLQGNSFFMGQESPYKLPQIKTLTISAPEFSPSIEAKIRAVFPNLVHLTVIRNAKINGQFIKQEPIIKCYEKASVNVTSNSNFFFLNPPTKEEQSTANANLSLD